MLCYGHAMLCHRYVMSCYVVLFHVTLCYARCMLCYVILCEGMLCCYVRSCYAILVTLCYVMLCYVIVLWILELLWPCVHNGEQENAPILRQCYATAYNILKDQQVKVIFVFASVSLRDSNQWPRDADSLCFRERLYGLDFITMATVLTITFLRVSNRAVPFNFGEAERSVYVKMPRLAWVPDPSGMVRLERYGIRFFFQPYGELNVESAVITTQNDRFKYSCNTSS